MRTEGGGFVASLKLYTMSTRNVFFMRFEKASSPSKNCRAASLWEGEGKGRGGRDLRVTVASRGVKSGGL